MRIPCIIITRDRLSYTKQCVQSLEQFDMLDIHIVDHGSTYIPMIDYLIESKYSVHLAGDRGPRDLWTWYMFRDIVGDCPYLVTDCDVVLDDDCPSDWLGTMFDHLDHGPGHLNKVGLGLRIDDLPDTRLGRAARQWEASFWHAPTEDRAYRAPVDTTLALYVPLSEQREFTLLPARRLAPPYLARHLPWYGDPDEAEAAYYKAHCLPGASHWVNGGWHQATVTS